MPPRDRELEALRDAAYAELSKADLAEIAASVKVEHEVHREALIRQAATDRAVAEAALERGDKEEAEAMFAQERLHLERAKTALSESEVPQPEYENLGGIPGEAIGD
jgi:hypothetical protein